MNTSLFFTLLFINIFSFILFKIDKKNSILGKRRISEFALCFVTLIGGTVGSLMSMQIYRHKTKKTSFIFKILIIVALQCSALFILADRI
ncbi:MULTISPECIES: DUF1294 domain-containing protein [Empedobacter]|uniref:DUF1294 domain-containing protein n=1 Tax=Empedobacter tilapiae TaxID=2491114 RepID=A0A4Z1BRI0_9FLAO|nr:DUF1294 domain-containing protein [Empedobacter tilapiae]TGN26412.1 DUF1294 domain-containing protein [Empedobacter tilapiae]